MTALLSFTKKNLPFTFTFLLLVLAAGYTNCNTSTVGSSDAGSGTPSMSILSSAGFTKDAYAEVLRSTYLKLAYQLPVDTLLIAIQNAASDEEAKNLYEQGIDSLLDTGLMELRFQNYFKGQLDVWSDNNAESQVYMRYPVNLGVYIALSSISINELFLADYAVSDDYLEIDASYENGPPTEHMAGFITQEAYVEKYMNEFKFHMVREVLGLGLNSVAPYTDIDIYKWDASMLSYLYRFNPEISDINCETCHVVNNWARLAFKNYDARGLIQYFSDHNQGINQFDTEEYDPEIPEGALEPQNTAGEPYPEEDIENYTKLTDNGASISSPRDLALQITQHPEFSRAWTERLLTIIFDLSEGTTGPNKEVPEHFGETETQIEFLDKWTEIFENENRIIKEFFRKILKDKDYISRIL